MIAYFDNAATTFPKPEEVYAAMDNATRNFGVTPGRGQHILSAKANRTVENARELILELLHCTNKKAVFTHTATEAINLILNGLHVPEGANVYISPFEHNAVTRTLYHLSKKTEFNLITLSIKDSYVFDLTEIQKQFADNKPYLLVVSHVSNVFGCVAPVTEIFSIAKKYDAITVLDMCQSAGLFDLQISSDIFDYVVFAGHKTLYGPLGISGFISAFPQKLDPLIFGGTGVHSASQEMPDDLVQYEAGSHSSTLASGFEAALLWIRQIGIEHIFQKEQENRQRLIEILNKKDNITIYAPLKGTGIISCIFDGYSPNEIGQILGEKIACRTGLQCAPFAHDFIGTFPAGTVRFSVGYFNTQEDFLQLDEMLTYIEDNS